MAGDRGGRASPVMTAWLVHPATVLAAVVLILNDHVLKAAYPGVVTGKLSDVAGLVLLPPLVSVVMAAVVRVRPGTPVAVAGLVASGLAFVAVKAAPAGAAAVSTAFSAVNGPSVILADRTDLAALPALGVSAWVWTRARRRPASRDTLRRFAVVVVLPTAAFAVMATSAPDYPDTVEVGSWRELVVIGQANAYHDREPRDWSVSDQGGAAWRPVTDEERVAFGAERRWLVMDARQACVPDDRAHCYRVVPGHLRVEETTDGGRTWTVSWAVPDGRRSYLARSLGDVGDVSVYLSSLALAVHPVPGGHVVVVANGRDGCAVRDAAGTWRRVAFGAYHHGEVRPVPLSGNTGLIGREWVITALVGLVSVHIGAWRAAWDVEGGLVALWGTAAAGVVGTLFGILALVVGDVFALAGGFAIALGILLTLCTTIGVLVVVARQAEHGARWALLTLLAASVTAAGWVAPFLIWVGGWLSYPLAIMLAAAAVLAGLALAAHLGQQARRRYALVAPAQPPVEPSRDQQ